MYDFFFHIFVSFTCNARIFISFLFFLVALTKTHNFAIYIISCSNFTFCFFVISITFSSSFFASLSALLCIRISNVKLKIAETDCLR